MEQHPLPQNISSYQFRLIGDMTLRQFLLLLSGGFVGFIFYSTNLPGFIKWFFVLISVLVGIGFAFMPLEGRPLDQWLMAFIKAIYNPTQFYWKKNSAPPEYLTSTTITKKSPPPAPIEPTRHVPSPPPQSIPEPVVSADEKKRLDAINGLFSQSEKSTTTPSVVPPIKKSSKPSASVLPQKHPTPIAPPQMKTTPITPIRVVSQEKKPEAPKAAPTTNPQPEPSSANLPHVSGSIKPAQVQTASAAVFNPNLPFPAVSEQVNTLTGMVMDRDGKIIENAVIEIKNSQKNTVRATKTNSLGQFFSATPLETGSYFIEIEKEGYVFDTISLQLENKIYPPLEIKAKN